MADLSGGGQPAAVGGTEPHSGGEHPENRLLHRRIDPADGAAASSAGSGSLPTGAASGGICAGHRSAAGGIDRGRSGRADRNHRRTDRRIYIGQSGRAGDAGTGGGPRGAG